MADLKSELSGDLARLILGLMLPPDHYDAKQLKKAMEVRCGQQADKSSLCRCLRDTGAPQPRWAGCNSLGEPHPHQFKLAGTQKGMFRPGGRENYRTWSVIENYRTWSGFDMAGSRDKNNVKWVDSCLSPTLTHFLLRPLAVRQPFSPWQCDGLS